MNDSSASKFELLDPVRNVVALDEDDFVEPGQHADLEFDDSRTLDEWDEVDSSDFELSGDDPFEDSEFDDDEVRDGDRMTYARVLAS